MLEQCELKCLIDHYLVNTNYKNLLKKVGLLSPYKKSASTSIATLKGMTLTPATVRAW